MAGPKNEAISGEKSSAAKSRLPVLIVAVGRGRVGKTTFLNIVGQRFRERGARLDVWNIDPHGETGSIDAFFPDVRRPDYPGIDDRRGWLERSIEEQSASRRDVLLDVGGGDLVLQKMLDDLDLSSVAETMGVRVVIAQLVGPIVADIDHFDPTIVGNGINVEMLFVMNAGLIRGDTSPMKAFEPVFSSPVIAAARAKGAAVVTLPQLRCLDAVLERGLTFREAAERKTPAGVTPLSIFDVTRVYKWWTEGLDTTFARIPAEWLPYVESEPMIAEAS